MPDSLNSKMAELRRVEKPQRKQLEFKNIKEKSKFEINVKFIQKLKNSLFILWRRIVQVLRKYLQRCGSLSAVMGREQCNSKVAMGPRFREGKGMQLLPRILFRLLIINFLLTIIQILMKKYSTIALLAVLLVSCLTADCPIDTKQTKIYSDSVGLNAQDNKNAGNAQNLVFNYQFQQPFSSAPNVAIGLNEIQASSSPSLDLRVSNARTTQSGVYFQAESGQDSGWTSFKINFLASTRPDIEIGTASIKSPVVNPHDNTFNVIYDMTKDLPASGLKAKSFLQAINLESPDKTQIGVKQQSSSIANRQIYFSFSSPVRTSLVRSLTISIIVFNIYTPSILYADGVIDQNYVVSTLDLTIPRHGINELRTYIVGINSFETSAAQPISIYSAISEKFSLVIGPIDRNEIDFVSVSYLILSVIDCGSCQGNPLLFDGLCQPTCPAGFKALKGRCVPIKCQEGFTLNANFECIPICEKNEVYQSGTCLCVDGFYRINKVCDKCPEGFYYDFKALDCKPLCGANAQFRNGRCFCNSGFFLINNRCQPCAYGTVYDPTSQRCYNICAQNEVYSPQGCVCANGFNRINGVCARCPFRKLYDPDTKTCVCAAGLDLVYGECVPACRRNEIRVEGYCTCAPGFYLIDGLCNVCGPNSSFSTIYNRCICNKNFIQSPAGCVPNCTDQQRWENGKCVNQCLQTFEVFRFGKCVCYQDYERLNGVCVPSCLMYEQRDANGKCKCLPGYYKGSHPICQPVNCPPGTVFDAVRADCISSCKANEIYINGACYCRYGYNKANAYGDCVPNCGPSEINVNGFCECAPGLIRAAWGVCCVQESGIGKCPPGTIFIYGECRSPTLCGVNEYWCGSRCVCVNGFYQVNGECVPVKPTLVCPYNSVSNGINCLCKPGFFPVTPGLCDKCPPGTFWDGRQCSGGNGDQCIIGWVWNPISQCCVREKTCEANQEWDGITCRCIQGYFLINGKCTSCPPGTAFDGFKCSPGVPTKYCKDPFSFWNGFTCACISGYWPLADGKCVACPDGTFWDGTCCKPVDGRPIPLTVI